MMSLLQHVCEAIAVLYNIQSTPAQQQHAHKYLLEVSSSQDAWGVAGELLAMPDVETRHYGANLLYTKVKNDWATLPETAREDLHRNLLQYLQAHSTSTNKRANIPIAARLANVIVVVTLKRPGGVQALFNELAPMVETSPDLVLEILTVIPSHGALDRMYGQEQGMRLHLHKIAPDVMEVIKQLFLKRDAAIVHKLVDCLGAWQQHLDLSLEFLHKHGIIILLVSLCTSDPKDTVLISEVCEMLANVLCQDMEEDEEREHDKPPLCTEGCEVIIDMIVGFRAVYEQTFVSGSFAVYRPIVQLTTAVCECEIERLSKGDAKSLQLIDLMVLYASSNNTVIVQETFECWLRLQDIEVSERHPSLRAPLYAHLIGILLPTACLPMDFVSFDHHVSGFQFDDDEDGFLRFRSATSEVLLSTYYILGQTFFDAVFRCCKQTNNQWNVLECCVWALAEVATEVKEDVLDCESASPIDAQFSLLLHLVFGEQQASTAYASLAKTVCRVLGAYDFMYSRMPNVLTDVVRYLLSLAMVTPESGAAFRRLCNSCRSILANDSDLVKNIVFSLGGQQTDRWPFATRKDFISGISYLLGSVPGGEQYLLPIMVHIRDTIKSLCLTESIDLRTKEEVGSQQLLLISAVVDSKKDLVEKKTRRRTAKKGSKTDAPSTCDEGTIFFLKGVWEAVLSAKALCWSIKIVDALCNVYLSILDALGGGCMPLISDICSSTLVCFERSHAASCLIVIAHALTTFGANESAVPFFTDALTNICRSMMNVKEVDPHLSTQFFSVFETALKTCFPATVPCVAHVSSLAIQTFQQTQDRQCQRAVLDFLKTLLQQPPVSLCDQTTIENILSKHGADIVNVIMAAVANGWVVKDLVGNSARLLLSVLMSHPQSGMVWLESSVARFLTSPNLSEQDKTNVTTLLRNMTHTPRRFVLLLQSIFSICRSEESVDCLVAFAM